jgi:hypothetical protein
VAGLCAPAQTAFATNAVVTNAFLHENLPSATYPKTFYDVGNFDEMVDWINGPLINVSAGGAFLSATTKQPLPTTRYRNGRRGCTGRSGTTATTARRRSSGLWPSTCSWCRARGCG